MNIKNLVTVKTILITILLQLVIITPIKAQQFCSDAYEITSLPFKAYSVNTANADIDTTLKYCGSSINHGKDTIFSFTTTTNQYIDIELSNVIISNDALVSFYLIDACTDENFSCLGYASGGTFLISNKLLTAYHTYYILVTNALWGVSSFIFDIEVRNHYTFDVGILEVNEPRSTCELGSFHEASFDIKNFGNDSAYNFGVKVFINGTEYYYNFTDTLLPGEERVNFPFNHYDLSINSENTIKAIVDFSIDENANNDTVFILAHNLGWENNFPYFEDFETSNQKWVTEWDIHSNHYTSYQIGEPNAPTINHASSGNKCYVTNLIGNSFSYEKSMLVGPCFDFTNLQIPILEFDMWRVLDSLATVYVEYNDTETDNWIRLGEVGSGENWYDAVYQQNNETWLWNTSNWVTSKIRLDFLAHKPKVRFRFIYSNLNTQTPEGIAIDNIRIYEAPNHDIGITNIISPISKCLIGEDSIKVTIFNFSPDSSHTNFIVNAIIDDIYQLSDTVLQIVQPNSSINYTFKNTFNFNTNKEYKIKAYTLLTNDDNTSNDADSINVFNFENYNTFPYKNDFETNNGVWFTYGINSSWEYGITTDSVINTASSGSNIWATNLNGYHNSPEESYLTSSCFNLSDLTKPLIKFNANFDLYLDDGVTSSYVQMEYSNDYGTNWSILGNSTVNNWYTAGFSWTGKSQNWEQMYFNISDLIQFENTQFRFKLFALQAKTGFAFDDFEICNIPTSDFTYTVSSRNVITSNTSLLGETYKWLINDTLVSSEINPTLIVTEDTTQVTLIVYNSCFSDTLTKTIFTNGIYNLIANNVKIYPNPATTILTIEGKLTIETIEILDVTGKTVLTSSFREKEKKQFVNIRNLEKGIYFIKINNNSIVKFVKE